jgi:hypothetical protein
MLWSYITKTGLTEFTELVDLTVVTVAIPYLFSACARLSYLVSRRGGRELLHAEQPADGIQRGRHVHVGMSVHAASNGRCLYDGH